MLPIHCNTLHNRNNVKSPAVQCVIVNQNIGFIELLWLWFISNKINHSDTVWSSWYQFTYIECTMFNFIKQFIKLIIIYISFYTIIVYSERLLLYIIYIYWNTRNVCRTSKTNMPVSRCVLMTLLLRQLKYLIHKRLQPATIVRVRTKYIWGEGGGRCRGLQWGLGRFAHTDTRDVEGPGQVTELSALNCQI